MDKKGHVKSIKGQQQNRKKIYMLAEIEPCSTVTGGPISGTDPQALERIAAIMDKVFDYVTRQSKVTKKDLIIFMKQIGIHSEDNFKEDDLSRIIQGMIYD
jgi:hypothetical protein